MRSVRKVLLVGLLVSVLMTSPVLAGPFWESDPGPAVSKLELWQLFVWVLHTQLPPGLLKAGSQLDPVGCPPVHPEPPEPPEPASATQPKVGSPDRIS